MKSDIEPFRDKRLVYCWHSDLTYNYTGSAAWVVEGQLASAHHTLFHDVSKTMGHLPLEFFRKTLGTIPGWTQKIAQSFGRVLGLNQSFNAQFLPVPENEQWVQGWIAPEDQPAMTIDAYGDGARGVFKVLTPLVALVELISEDASGLFIWEEPELFQNPQPLGRLLAEIAALTKDKPIQIFIATHSLEVVAHFTALVRDRHLGADELMAFRFDLQNGDLRSSWFNADNLIAWMEAGLDPRVWSDFKPLLQFRFREEEE
jgi:hypothetical protein